MSGPSTSAAIRISAPGVSLQEIVDTVGLQPTVKHLAGESKLLGKRWAQDLWHYDVVGSQSKPRSLEDSITALLQALEPYRKQIAAIGQRTRPVLWCSLISNGPEASTRLSPQLLNRIAEFGLELDLSIYYGD